jgi:hypothetical protein
MAKKLFILLGICCSIQSFAQTNTFPSSGNVGIGTTSPYYPLTIVGSGEVLGVDNSTSFIAKNSSGTYEKYLWPRYSDNVMYLNYGSGGMNIRNNSSASTMFLTNSNNVLIGSTSDAGDGKLQVNGGISFSGLYLKDGYQGSFAVANLAPISLVDKELYSDVLQFNFPDSTEQYNGSSWVPISTPYAVFQGGTSYEYGLTVPYNAGNIRFIWNNLPYCYLEFLELIGTTNGNQLSIELDISSDGTNWTTGFITPNYSVWPGVMAYKKLVNNSGKYHLRITLLFDWNTGASNNMYVSNLRLFAAYNNLGSHSGFYSSNKLYAWDYNKNIFFNGGITVKSQNLNNSLVGYRNPLYLNAANYSSNSSVIEFEKNSTGLFSLGTDFNNNGGNDLYISGNGNILLNPTNNNVLIGETTQANSSYKLDVNGNIRADKLVVNTTGADYVFDPGYHLTPLDSLNNYIKTNHHLPGIKPASQMQQQGMDVGETQKELLQKVEELTLYVIRLNKQVQLQNNQLKMQAEKIAKLEKGIATQNQK